MSTHYTAGGMPLAFTQEDFLVVNYSTNMWYKLVFSSGERPVICL